MDEEARDAQTEATQAGDPAVARPSFEEWIKQQPADIQAAAEEAIRGLKNALESERVKRKETEKAAREALARAAAVEQELRFTDEARRAGCLDARLAFLAARDAGLVGDDGKADFAALRARFPTLFGVAVPPGHAAAGTASEPPPQQSMDGYIRAVAGARR